MEASLIFMAAYLWYLFVFTCDLYILFYTR